ncbi:hypothetical protein CLIB1423_33S00342 [[Candida] railenensis]|uniref:VPS9 domain-containing protein n=1 Tax=[Candida] railenensis TaxID=45579 RepID=A0A9P0QVF5_9ASCO|nr:hypothetical protein CLIB1423_33S00342 [[Candida] railenensis]
MKFEEGASGQESITSRSRSSSTFGQAVPYYPPPSPTPTTATAATSIEAIEHKAGEFTGDIHPQVNLLLKGFLKYLKEPRYQAPLTIEELSKLFQYFYKDLNSLTINLYTQLNSNKKKLISSSQIFSENDKKFDYLLAIANFSASTVKLTRREDKEALVQLRIFNYYKFLTIFETIERAQEKLFGTINSNPNMNEFDEEATSLYDKIFRFEQKDIIFQEFLEEKIGVLKKLNLPLSCFVEEDNNPLQKVFRTEGERISSEAIGQINGLFIKLNASITPLSKLKILLSIQKLLINEIARIAFDNDTSSVNNDILLPSLIYYIINYLPPLDQIELYLNFQFIKNFLNLIPVDNIDLTTMTPSMSLHSYTPTNKSKSANKQFHARAGKRYGSIYTFLNLKHEDNINDEEDGYLDKQDIFSNDKFTVAHIQKQFLNNGELMFYLTNFEAVLFFISNITLDDLKVNGGDYAKNELVNVPLDKLVDMELLTHFKFPSGEALRYEDEGTENANNFQELDEEKDVRSDRSLKEENKSINSGSARDVISTNAGGGTTTSNRSRSSSLFNTISNRLNDVANTANRSRSNSSILNSLKAPTKESFPSISSPLQGKDVVTSSSASGDSGDPESMQTSPVNSNELPHAAIESTSSSISVMKNILGKFSQVSVPQFRSAEDGQEAQSNQQQQPQISISENGTIVDEGTNSTAKKSPSRTSPVHSRTRSSSFDNHTKRNSLTSKFTTGMTELMTKLNNANTNTSSLSLHSLTEENGQQGQANSSALHPFIGDSPIKRPEYNRSRTTSLQIMDKWFSNISNMNITGNSTVIQPNAHLSHIQPTLTPTIEGIEPSLQFEEIVQFQNVEFESLTINDLKLLKSNYDKLCAMVTPILRNGSIDQSSHSEETSM